MLTVAVLGAVEARRDGQRLPVPTGKTTELLARLAVEAGTDVRVDTLLDDLWPDAAGRNTLQSKVSQLRHALGDKQLVAAGSSSYRLAVDPGSVDAVRAVDLARQASAALRAADAATALAKAEEGLQLFRGDILLDVGDWATPHRARLEEVRLALLEDLMSARVDLGAGGELVAELESLVAQHPLRERLWASLMTALYRGGRQAGALAAYGRVRTLLVDELGVEPGPELRALERELLLQPSSALGSDSRPPVAAPGNVPPSEGPVFGRDDDLAALRGLVAAHRVVTVIGPAGVGKTRLLLELAPTLRAPGGVWLVRLEDVTRAASLEQLIAETLRVAGSAQLRDRLAGARTVLLLDNCEHLVANVGELVRSLLDDVPSLRVVATSQAPLGIEHELVHHLRPLSAQESVALFLVRAQRARRQLVIDDATEALVAEVCRSLDGLPLAIELAAARVRSLSVRDIARRLDDRFALLRDPSSSRPERRRALAGAIAWSYDLLFPDDQRTLWALSCFAGSASLAGVEHVMAALGVPPDSVVDSLTRLVDRSLVTVDPVPAGLVRYRVLDSIRAYGADRLTEAGLAEVACRAHAHWYAEIADWCDEHVRGKGQSECLAVIRAERSNIDAALAWCGAHEPKLGLRIATRFGWGWVVLGDGAAGATRIRDAITAATPLQAPIPELVEERRDTLTGRQDRARAFLLAGWLEASAGNVAVARADLGEAGRLADQLGDDELRAGVHLHRAFLALQEGRPEEALSCATVSLATDRRSGRGWETATSLVLSAYGSLQTGDTAAATRSGQEAVRILTPIGDSWGMVHAQAMLGGIAQAEHRFDQAADALARAAEESSALGFLGQAALHLSSLARVQQRAGHLEIAAASFDRALAAAAAGGDARLAATVRLNLARQLRATGEGAAAIELLEQNLAWYASAGGGEGALLSRCLLAAETEDVPALEELLTAAGAEDNREVGVLALDALARAAAVDMPARARELIAEADGLQPVVAHVLDESDRLDRRRAIELLSS